MSTRSITTIPTFRMVELRNIPFERRAPVLVLPTQDPDWAKTALFGGLTFPYVELRLIELDEAYFVIGDEADGIVFDSDRILIEETAYFTPSDRVYDLDAVAGTLDEVFIGFDAAWSNYFHWLCYALPKAVIARSLLGERLTVVFPDMQARIDGSLQPERLRYSLEVWRESLAFFGLSGHCTVLEPGIYKARKIHMLWTHSESPTEFIHTNAFRQVFDTYRKGLPNRTIRSREVYISRAQAPDKRVDPGNEAEILAFCRQNSIEIVQAETLTFTQQVNLFNSCELVIAPHGAGLSNMLFGTPRLQVLELNKRIGSDDSLRPWFYMIASCLNLTYAYLDGTAQNFLVSDLASCVRALRALRRDNTEDINDL